MISSWQELLELDSFSDYLIAHKTDKFTLPTFENSTIELEGGDVLINMFLLGALHRRGILPQTFALYKHGQVFNDKVRRDMENSIIFHPLVRQLPFQEKQAITRELFYDTDALSNISTTRIPESFKSLSMIEIANTMEDPKVKEIIAFDPYKYLKKSLKTLEVETEKHNKKIVKGLKELKENNCFRPYLLTDCFNEGQFFQSVCCGGTRTDVDDTAVNLPIVGNYINGLNGNIEYIIESFSARKSEDYNKEHMGNASYTKRKINLMASALTTIYQGSCSSTDTLMDYIIPANHIDGYLGRNVKEEDGTISTIMPWNKERYVNRPLNIYSPITCDHTDGCCHRCGGMVLELMPPSTKIGQAATEQIMNPLQQSILSSKHLMKTLIQLFFFPEPLDEFFTIDDGDIYLQDLVKEDFSIDDIRIGVPTEGVQNISELNEYEGDTLPGSYFSAIPSIAIAHDETGEVFVGLTDVVANGKIIPHFTAEFLGYLKRNKENIIYNGNMMWFTVKGFDRDQPIMEFDYVSESAYIFIQKIEQFFAREAKDGGLSSYNSATRAIYDLTRLLRHRIACNSLHVELLIKSAMISSPTDMSIPRIHDAEGVLFGRMPHINTFRNIANEAAFERWSEYTHDPRAYIYPSKSGLLDPFLGFYDYQHEDEYRNNKDLFKY